MFDVSPVLVYGFELIVVPIPVGVEPCRTNSTSQEVALEFSIQLNWAEFVETLLYKPTLLGAFEHGGNGSQTIVASQPELVFPEKS